MSKTYKRPHHPYPHAIALFLVIGQVAPYALAQSARFDTLVVRELAIQEKLVLIDDSGRPRATLMREPGSTDNQAARLSFQDNKGTAKILIAGERPESSAIIALFGKRPSEKDVTLGPRMPPLAPQSAEAATPGAQAAKPRILDIAQESITALQKRADEIENKVMRLTEELNELRAKLSR